MTVIMKDAPAGIDSTGGGVDFGVPLFDHYDPANLGCAFMQVTPEIAALWLTRNKGNRPVHEDYKTDYAGRVRRGEFSPTNQGVGIAYDGKLLDGQKRLMAIRDTGKTVTILVAWGLNYDAQEKVDNGQIRRLNTTFSMKGYTNVTNLLAAARLVYTAANRTLYTSAKRRQLSPQQLTTFVTGNENDLYDALSMAGMMVGTSKQERAKGVPFTISSAAALRFLIMRANPTWAPQFWARVYTGEHDIATDPCWVLRSRIFSEAIQRSARRGRPSSDLLVLGLKAWAAFLADTPIQKLVLDPDQSVPEIATEAAESLAVRLSVSAHGGK